MNAPRRGCFITLEGGEGSGKSTQVSRLAEAFVIAGLPHLVTREPGGTTGAESIRKLLVEGDGDRWDPMTETVLFMAARVDHVRKKIIPALRKGTHVICDRFADSTMVYQGLAKGLGEEFITLMHNFCLGDFQPDLTLIFDITPEEGLKRAGARKGNENRFEGLDISFHQKIREGFLQIALEHPSRCAVVDASQASDQVQKQVAAAIRERLGLAL